MDYYERLALKMGEALKNADFMLLEQVEYKHKERRMFAHFFDYMEYSVHRSILRVLSEQKLAFTVVTFPTTNGCGWMERAKKAIQGTQPFFMLIYNNGISDRQGSYSS